MPFAGAPSTKGLSKSPILSLTDFYRSTIGKVDMENRPVDFKKRASYDPLIVNGQIILDHENNPVGDMSEPPLTLSTKIALWILIGLRRSLRIEMAEYVL